MIPSFRIQGGKARLRRWLADLFPPAGRTYLEPFAGRGNVYWHARSCLRFSRWVLADTDTRFLQALLRIDPRLLPERVDRDLFCRLAGEASAGDPVALVLEPRVTFAGKGYPAGFSGSSGTHVGYSRANYLRHVLAARQLLASAEIREASWEESLQGLGPEDFAYLDPPYEGTRAPYKGVDHAALVDRLNALPCMWAVSGYSSPLYDARLKWASRHVRERNSEIRSSNEHVRAPVTEVLWTSYRSAA